MSSLVHSLEPVVETQDRHFAQVQFVVSAQYAFFIYKDDESFREGDSQSPPGLSIGPCDHEVSALGAEWSHGRAQYERTVRANLGPQKDGHASIWQRKDDRMLG